MIYCRSRGIYYVQLEDDIISRPGYFTAMKSYSTEMAKKVDWFMIDFCSLGSMGKMYKTSELNVVIFYFAMFQNAKPIDWLIDDFMQTRFCDFIKGRDGKSKYSKYRIRYRPSLFQHVGRYSSRTYLEKVIPWTGFLLGICTNGVCFY